jgi:FlaG/FlaF family flagellin (archaellin)
MKSRVGVSPFVATVVLVAITLALGGVLYTQFKQVVSSEVRNPSISLIDANVGQDGKTLLIDVKNDGNVQLTLSQVLFQYQALSEHFSVGGNASVLAGSATILPGSIASIRLTLTGVTLPSFSEFTLTLVSDQLAKAFSVEA